MNGQEKNKLPRGERRPPLRAGDPIRERSREIAWRRLHRWSKLYFLTALAAILSVSILLLSGSVSPHALKTASFWGRNAERLGAVFLGQEFFGANEREESDTPPLQGIVDALDQLFHPDRNEEANQEAPSGNGSEGNPPKEEDPPRKETLTKETLYAFDYDAVPLGKTPVIPMNLALSSYGASYIHNGTGYRPDTAALLAGSLKQSADFEYLAASGQPMVLIVHTHATESFCEDGASFCDTTGEYARSNDPQKNMIAVGNRLAEELSRRGISTLHCTVAHDAVQYKDSYRRSEESIRQYLEKYPTIRLVIDLHRDAVVQSDGDVVRPVTLYEGEAAAQLMCVVGSSYGGEACPNWEGNLALALKLRQALNLRCADLCRPPYLKSSTYNQELAPYSLLVEAGAGGNSLAEVERSMVLLADALCELLPQM